MSVLTGLVGELSRPSILVRPRLYVDQGKWWCLIGPNPQEGVAGSRQSLDEAMRDFDGVFRRAFPGNAFTRNSPGATSDGPSPIKIVRGRLEFGKDVEMFQVEPESVLRAHRLGQLPFGLLLLDVSIGPDGPVRVRFTRPDVSGLIINSHEGEWVMWDGSVVRSHSERPPIKPIQPDPPLGQPDIEALVPDMREDLLKTQTNLRSALSDAINWINELLPSSTGLSRRLLRLMDSLHGENGRDNPNLSDSPAPEQSKQDPHDPTLEELAYIRGF